MKKILSLILAILMLIACCACGQQPAEEIATEATPAETQPETPEAGEAEVDPLAGIDESVPDADGNYPIITAEGLLNVANMLDGSFILMCDIDLGGIDWTPIGTQAAPFTGKFNGNNFTISNFTITQNTADGDMGMFGVNAGQVVNVYTDNVTMTTNKDTKQAGMLVANNQGKIRRSVISGVIDAAQLAEDAKLGGLVGYSSELVETSTANVDLNVSTTGKASVGGIIGHQEGNIIRSCVAGGALLVTDGSNKNVGLFAGVANDAEMTECQFLGEANKVDGQLFLECIGAQNDVTTNTGYALRDNSIERVVFPADVQARRDKVIATAYEMATVEWTVEEPLQLNPIVCTCCKSIMFLPGKNYRGIPYNHKNGSMQRFYYAMELNEDGKYVPVDWVYENQERDTWDMYIGNDCSSAAQQIYASAIIDCQILRSRDQFPISGGGTIPVGGWVADIPLDATGVNSNTKQYIEATGIDEMYRCYAQTRAGDLMGNIVSAGGHCRILVEDPVVMLDEEGNLDPEASYMIVIEQVASFVDFEADGGYTSSWRVDAKYSFKELMDLDYVPMTFRELNESGEIDPEVSVEETTDGRMGLITGKVVSNMPIDSVVMIITDDQGNEILNHRMFTNLDKTSDSGSEYVSIRLIPREFDLAHFTAITSQIQWDLSKTYHCTIIALHNNGMEIVAREFDF